MKFTKSCSREEGKELITLLNGEVRTIWTLAVDQDAIRGRQFVSIVQRSLESLRNKSGRPMISTTKNNDNHLRMFHTSRRRHMPHLVVGAVPVADEHGVLAGRRGERDGDLRAALDADGAEATGGLVERQRREVEEAADLVLGLHMVREVLARRDRAVGAGQAILPRVLALLQTVPANL